MASEIITFDVTAFRQQFPSFADETAFPDETLQGYWDAAICYISDENSCCSCFGMDLATQTRALNLLTAHLTALSVIIAGGQIPVLVSSATIDKVTVSLTPPPLQNQWQWWLSLTPYGQQLLALLQVNSVGGCYIGGSPERAAFRGLTTWGSC